MTLIFKESYKRSYKKRFIHDLKTKKQIAERLDLFLSKPQHPLLKLHALKGNQKGYYSFSVSGDVRIVFYISKGDIYLVDIGTHNQVYK